ncbi:MAG: type I restriction enzyme S subunit [Moritella dasanensis]
MKLIPITEVCDFQGGSQPPKSQWSSEKLTGYIRMLQIRDFTQSERTTPEYVKETSNLKKCNVDDILIGRYGASVGKILTGHAGAYNVAIVRTIPDENKLNKKFLYYILKSPLFQNFILNVGGRAAQAGFNKSDLKKFKIPNLAINDQIRIAKLLGKIEALVTQRKQHLQELDKLIKGIFMDMFGSTHPNFKDWPLVEIKDLAESHKRAMRTGPFGSNLLHSEFTEDGEVAVLGIDNAVKNRFAWDRRRYVTSKKYEELKNYTIYPRDVIVTIMGTIGRSAVIPEDIPLAINTKHLAAITLNKKIANPIFLSYSIHTSPYILEQFKSKNRGAIMDGLNLGIIKETKIRRPPVELQNKFEDIYLQVEKVRTEYSNSLALLESLYGSLSDRAFKGKLDLSNINININIDSDSDVAIVDEFELAEFEREEDIKISNKIAWEEEYPMSSGKGRSRLILAFYDAYMCLADANDFSIDKFFDYANMKSLEYMDDDDKPFGFNEYELIKSLLFNEIRSNKIKQTRNKVKFTNEDPEDNSKSIDKLKFGNSIQLRSRRGVRK